MAAKEAKQLSHTYVGTEHILLGLLREGNGVAAKVLRGLDIDLDQTRQEILKEVDPNFQESEEYAASAEDGEKAEKKAQSKTPALKAFGRDLTEIALKGDMDPVIGGKMKLSASSKSFADAPKTILCFWERLALGRPPSSRVWLKKSQKAMCLKFFATSA